MVPCWSLCVANLYCYWVWTDQSRHFFVTTILCVKPKSRTKHGFKRNSLCINNIITQVFHQCYNHFIQRIKKNKYINFHGMVRELVIVWFKSWFWFEFFLYKRKSFTVFVGHLKSSNSGEFVLDKSTIVWYIGFEGMNYVYAFQFVISN